MRDYDAASYLSLTVTGAHHRQTMEALLAREDAGEPNEWDGPADLSWAEQWEAEEEDKVMLDEDTYEF